MRTKGAEATCIEDTDLCFVSTYTFTTYEDVAVGGTVW